MQDDPRDLSGDGETTPGEPAAAPVAVKPTRTRSKAVVAAPPIKPVPRAPFRMSYDGTTDKDYIAPLRRRLVLTIRAQTRRFTKKGALPVLFRWRAMD